MNVPERMMPLGWLVRISVVANLQRLAVVNTGLCAPADDEFSGLVGRGG